MLPELIERRLSLVVTAASVAVFLGFLLILPAFYPSFDEWKYFGIGYNIWAGKGITTVFGGSFLLHGPVWPLSVTAPRVFLGWDSASWGHLLGGLSGASIVALAGWFGWRIRPAAGAFAAIAMVGILYLHDQSRTARLDVPAAAFTLLYLAIAFEALRRGSTRWAIGAGAAFAIGFLIKEINLPFAPIPFFAAALWGRPWPVIARVMGWTLLVATIGLAWWFVLYAIEVGTFYRLETPAWTLIPLAVAVAALIALGLGTPRLALTERVRRFAASDRAAGYDRAGRIALAVGGSLAWAGAQLYAYSRTARLKGGPILTEDQIALYARTWFSPYWFVVILGAVGTVLSIAALAAYWRRPERRRPMVDLFIALICGAPLVILVVGVGEPPRNYLAQLALVAPLAATGWLWAAEWFVGERRPALTVPLTTVGGAAAGLIAAVMLRQPPYWPLALVGALAGFALGWLPILGPRLVGPGWARARTAVVSGLLVAGLLAATGVLGIHGLAARPAASGPARDAAIRATDAWIRENIPAGTKLAFGSFLGYEMALTLTDRHDSIHARHKNVIASPTAPEGIVRAGEEPSEDWVSVDTAPRNVNEFQAFRAEWLIHDLVESGIEIWVYTIGTDTSAQTVLAAATPENGFEQLSHMSFEIGTTGREIETYIFRIHPEQVRFDPDTIYMSPEALDRVLGVLEADPAAARDAAASIERQVVIVPTSPLDDALMARLRALAGG